MGDRIRTRWRGALLLAVAMLAIGCDNTLDPFVDGARTAEFAFYGFLDSRADTQFVRVSPMINSATFDYPERLDARVILTDLTSMASVELRDSSVAIEDNRRSYIYFTTEPVAPDRSFLLEVFAEAGDTMRAITHVPGASNIAISEASRDSRGLLIQSVEWQMVSRIRSVEVTYRLATSAGPMRMLRPYAAPVFASERTVLQLEVDSRQILMDLAGEVDTGRVALDGLEISAELHSPEWSRPVSGDPTFFAAVSRATKSWTLPDSLVLALGFQVP